MLFNSNIFIFGFLPLILFLYWLFRGRAGGLFWANAVLAVGSYVFYLSGEKTYPWLLLVSIAFNFMVGRQIEGAEAGRRRWLAIGVGGDLAALAYFKYFGFLCGALHDLGLTALPVPRIILPIGISFFTFTQIAYLVDVYQRKASRSNPVDYALFVGFYPHLIAGPILHHGEMMPQFARRHLGRLGDHFPVGLSLFAIGLFKKTVIADTVAPLVNGLFDLPRDGSAVTLLTAWVAALAYAMQIYFDFSGYSDMAIGLGRMLGIELPVNFNSPYKARSIAEFWRRWHITLSRFLRDYVYIPLGGNRRGEARRTLNLFVTMLLGGLWHGAGWTFCLWGALHGACLAVERVWKSAGLPGLAPPWIARPVTLALVLFAWVPFRAPDIRTTLALWKGMLGMNGVALPGRSPDMILFAHKLGFAAETVPYTKLDVILILGLLAACLLLPNSQQLMAPARVGLDSPGYQAIPPAPRRWGWRMDFGWAIAVGVLFGLGLRTIGGYSQFIYFQF